SRSRRFCHHSNPCSPVENIRSSVRRRDGMFVCLRTGHRPLRAQPPYGPRVKILNFEAGYMHAVFPHATQRRVLAARSGSIYAPILRARHHTTLSAFGSAAEDGGASKAEPASAALIAVANSSGVPYPKLLRGRSSLSSIFHAVIFRRASNRF